MDLLEIVEAQKGIEGMLMDVSAATWCVLLQAQQATWTWDGLGPGHYLEIGTYKGKAASILARFSRENGNQLTIVDPKVLPQARATLDAISNRITYLEIPSEQMVLTSFVRDNARSMAWSHIDGMHSFSAVASDLAVCEAMTSEYGIVCVDDFHTDLYPQIPAAVYKYLYGTMTDLCIFLVGFNKAYLCRNSAKRYYSQFVLDNLHWSLKELGHPVTLVKTDRNANFDAYSIVPFQGDPRYGEAF